MRLQDRYVSIEHRFSLGEELGSQIFYLSIPVSNGIVDYEEFYRLDRSEFQTFLADPEQARSLVERCHLRDEDERLIQKPGWNRGIPA
ncbi:hypothetical protein [Klugiella xanthotipulae]|nr:hypothetical protein [Klugiella xanthotipulae]